jgi:hypothetical protein
MRPGEMLDPAASYTRIIHLELPRATGVARCTSESFELRPLMHMDHIQAANALKRQQ